MLEFYDQSSRCPHVCNMQFPVLGDEALFLVLCREQVLPVKVPLSFRLRPTVAALHSLVSPVPHFLLTTFCNNSSKTVWANCSLPTCRLNADQILQCVAQDSLHDSSMAQECVNVGSWNQRPFQLVCWRRLLVIFDVSPIQTSSVFMRTCSAVVSHHDKLTILFLQRFQGVLNRKAQKITCGKRGILP